VVTTDEVVARRLQVELGSFRLLQRALTWNGAYRLMRHLRPGPQDVFLDIGCGAGRVVCTAARFHLARVIGVDLDPRMARLAAENARSLRRRRCPLEVVEADGARFELPDDVTIVFLYNPFGGETLDSALQRLLESIARRPRRMRLVCANPREHERIIGSGRFRPTTHMSLGWRPGGEWARTQRVQVYEVQGPPA
jgi:SAM-dependent methyltransferase